MRFAWFLVLGVAVGSFMHNACPGQSITAADSGNHYFIAATAQLGKILIDNQQSASLVKNNPWAFQLDFGVVKNTERTWNYCNCYTQTGISLSVVNFGNPANLGNAINVAAYTEPYLAFSKKFQFSFRGGAGFSYLNKIFDADTNPDNIFYSRHISFILLLNLNAYAAVTPALRARLTTQFTHVSNGGTRDPNWGINFPTIGIGLEYALQPQQLQRRKIVPFTDRLLKIITHVFGGPRTLQSRDAWPERKGVIVGINAAVVKPLGRISALGVGGELYYDGTSNAKQSRYGGNYSTRTGSVCVQHYFFFGKLLFGQQLAYQVTHLNPDVSNNIYQRYILGYRIKKNWYGGISLKTYGNISDYTTVATGFIF